MSEMWPVRASHPLRRGTPEETDAELSSSVWRRASERRVSHLRLWWLLFLNGKIEKCTRSCHGKGKAQKLFTYRRVPSGAAVWQIINKLFIWRETCFFDGGELKKRAALPYCVSTELWLEKSFVSAQEKEGRPLLGLGETPVLCEDRSFLQAWLNCTFPTILCWSCNCWHVNNLLRIEEPPLPFGLRPESTVRCETLAEADSGAVPESKGGANGGERRWPHYNWKKLWATSF